MARVMTTCDVSGRPTFTRHRMKPDELASVQEPRSFRCADCNSIHSWTRDAAWLDEPRGPDQEAASALS